MIYRNKKTGITIDIPSELISPDWEKITPENDGEKEKKRNERNSVRKRK